MRSAFYRYGRRALILTLLCSTRLPAQSVTLTYLGNMGVLLESGERRIVIDGLHHGELADYATIPDQLLVPLEQAKPPYQRLTAALTTHRHPDHFNAQSVRNRLLTDSAMIYGAARETVDTLISRTGTAPAGRRISTGPPNGTLEWPVSEGIVGLVLPHNPTPSPRVANVGFLVDLGGLRVLHVGDADPTPATYTGQRLASRQVDVAIVPFWYLLDADDSVRRLIGARIWVASHVPPADTASTRKRVRQVIPNAIVLTTPGERYTLK